MDIDPSQAALVGTLGGVFLRTAAPYLLQLAKGKKKFEAKYLRSAAVSALLTVIGGAVAIPQLAPNMDAGSALWLGITTSFSLQSMLRYGEKAVTDE